MTVTALVLVLLAGCGLLAVVLNHCQARLALVELVLNEGLPPGYDAAPTDPSGTSSVAADSAIVAAVLRPGVHVFLSRTCHACQRLIDELDGSTLDLDAELHLRYIDRPRPIASSAAERQAATLHEHDAELATQVGADPLPYTIAVGAHGLVSRAVSPTAHQIMVAARDAGITAAAADTP